jgi:hypothetical protein
MAANAVGHDHRKTLDDDGRRQGLKPMPPGQTATPAPPTTAKVSKAKS